MLELASVEGRSFSSRAVAELSGDETRGDLEALLAELVQKELVRPGTRPGSLLLPAPAHPRRRLRVDPSPPGGLHDRLARILAVTGPGSGTASELAAYSRSGGGVPIHARRDLTLPPSRRAGSPA